jgi:hypothetical protein
MVSPLPVAEDAAYRSPDQNAVQEVHHIRATYSQSGLYRNNGSTAPLWTIRYFSRPREGLVHIGPDGNHLIFGAEDTFVGWFFQRGTSLAAYSVQDVVSNYRIKTFMNLSFPSCVWSHFDADRMTYAVRTNHGEEFTFDVTTGTLISQRTSWTLYIAEAVAGIATVSGIVVAVLLFCRRHRAKQKSCSMAP